MSRAFLGIASLIGGQFLTPGSNGCGRSDHGLRDDPRAVSAHKSRRTVVAAAVLRADRRLGGRDVHHAAASSGALQHRGIGFEDRELGHKGKGDNVKMQGQDTHTKPESSQAQDEATSHVIHGRSIKKPSPFWPIIIGRRVAVRMIHLTRTGFGPKPNCTASSPQRHPPKVRGIWS